jgi:hypothetical protein
MFLLGQQHNQEYLFEAQLRLGGVEALMEVAHRIAELHSTLSGLAETLPDLQAQMAFPISAYDRFRDIYDCPSPLQIPILQSFAILLLADRESLETIHAQITAVRSQTTGEWKLHVIGTGPAQRRVTEQAGVNDARIVWSEALPNESAAQAEQRIARSIRADWILLLAETALLHPHAIEWFTSVIGVGTARAFVADEELGASAARFDGRPPSCGKWSITIAF